MMRTVDIKTFLPRIMPQVLPCPASMIIDAVQAVSVDFFKATEVWTETFTDELYTGDSCYDVPVGKNTEVVRVKSVYIEGGKLSESSYYAEGRSVIFRTLMPRQCILHVAVALRPSRMAESLPRCIVEEWGDCIAYGAIAKLKAMSGKGIEWSDPQGAGIALQLYNDGVGKALARSIRARHGSGPLYALGDNEYE